MGHVKVRPTSVLSTKRHSNFQCQLECLQTCRGFLPYDRNRHSSGSIQACALLAFGDARLQRRFLLRTLNKRGVEAQGLPRPLYGTAREALAEHAHIWAGTARSAIQIEDETIAHAWRHEELAPFCFNQNAGGGGISKTSTNLYIAYACWGRIAN